MKLTDKAGGQLDALLTAFETGDVIDAVTRTVIEGNDAPMRAWSFHNQILCYLHGTTDARGFRQWKDVNRHVKKGAKALYILIPLQGKKRETDEATGEETERAYTYGFKAAPVFALEDTDGEPLPEPEPLEPSEPPPLSEIAQAWNIPVEYVPFCNSWYGYYGFNFFEEKIVLATHDEATFYHELAHAAHRRIKGHLQRGQNWRQEVVAELSAAVIARLFGKTIDGAAFKYIRSYAEAAGQDAHTACVKVLTDVRDVLNLILSTAEQMQPEAAAAD